MSVRMQETRMDRDETTEQDMDRPEHEPAAATLSGEQGPGPSAPDGEAPDMDEIEPGDGPGQSPGE